MPQKVKTFYKEAEKEKEGLKHHEERREEMRKLRSQQEPFVEKAKRAVNTVKNNPTLKSVVGKVQERGREIADDQRPARRGPPQRFSSSMGLGGGEMGMGMPSGDLFGVGNYGGFDHMRPPARQNDAPKKRRKKRKTTSAPAPRRQAAPRPPTGIPSHMKWMFGQ